MKLSAFFSIPEVLKQGKVVTNPIAWKTGQITVSFLAGFLGLLVGALKLFGVELPITDEQLTLIASSILTVFGLFNPVATVASTDKLGIKSNNN